MGPAYHKQIPCPWGSLDLKDESYTYKMAGAQLPEPGGGGRYKWSAPLWGPNKWPYYKWVQGGPLPSYKWSYKSIYRGYNPSYPFIRPFIGVITPFITGRGPPCSWP